MKKPVIYIAGAYRGPTESAVFDNIMRARDHAIHVWQLGAIALCPHLNSMLMGGISGVPDQDFLDGDIELLDRCDALYAIRGWEQSSGAKKEVEFAKANGMPVFFSESTYFLQDMTDFIRYFKPSSNSPPSKDTAPKPYPKPPDPPPLGKWSDGWW